MLTMQRIDDILTSLPRQTIGLLGDLFLDRYLDIDPALDEPSVETGLTAYQVVRVRSYPGALGTVLNNLSALGVGRILPLAIIGDDGEGYELRQALDRTPGVESSGLVVRADRRTPTYTKPMRGAQELNRLDIKNRSRTPADAEEAILVALDRVWGEIDALIVLDQVSEANCGVVTERVRRVLADLGQRDPEKFILADSRDQIGLFQNVCVKPNRSECERAIGHASGTLPQQLAHPAEVLAGRTQRIVFCTEGEQGMRVQYPDGQQEQVPAFLVHGPIDICGAGDSCSAAITAAIVSKASPREAAAFGNLVANITIQQIGTTGTANPTQIQERWQKLTSTSR